jgi:hypothetical protein
LFLSPIRFLFAHHRSLPNDTPIISELLLPARDPRLAHGEHHHWTIRLTDRAVDELLDVGILSAILKQVKAEY